MGERVKPHSYRHEPSAPRVDYSHMVMVMRSLMERCSSEWRRRPTVATARLQRDGGDPWPPSILEMVEMR